MISSRFFYAGLGAAALFSLGAARPALAQSGGANYNYTITFETPASFTGAGAGDVRFEFDPQGPNPAPASITGSGLTYSGDWQVNPFGITTFGDTKFDYSTQSLTVKNTDARNGFVVPVGTWGSTFGFSLNYADPPGTDPSNFSLTLQKAGQPDLSLFAIGFDPSGQTTLLSTTPGVSITPQAGTPGFGPAAVPEASTTVSLGLLLTLGLGAVALRKKAAARIN